MSYERIVVGLRLQAFTTVAVAMLVANSALATELVVKITGISTKAGTVGCALFNQESGFPGDPSVAASTEYITVSDDNAIDCVFKHVEDGIYAVSVSHDVNDNGKTDVNFMGVPKEAWGVSQNVRPRMRAPKFSEASFTIAGQTDPLVIDIKLK